MKRISIYQILFVYFILSITTLFIWNNKKINTLTGDEPHYLVMADGIAKYLSFEQTKPYRDEFKNKNIYKHGLAPVDAEPSAANTHAHLGPNGLFNGHNIGLPLLIAIPFKLAGTLGAKIFMIISGGLIIILSWKFSSFFSNNLKLRFWIIIAAVLSLPLIPLSNQIYPDLIAGLLSLAGLYWFISLNKKTSINQEILWLIAIALLPWLQIKYTATCFLIAIFIAIKTYLNTKKLQNSLTVLLIVGLSCLAQAFYNVYAFGQITGPYQASSLEISKTSLMVLLGLHFDQNQGFLFHNPIYLVGILGVGWMYKFNRTFTILWGLVFLSLIVPNGLHTHWYGGGSVSGRFSWAAAVVFIVPTLYGLLIIANKSKKTLAAIIASGIALQLYFFYLYAIKGVHIYNKGISTNLNEYSIYYSSIHSLLPKLYNIDWAFKYLPNYVWFFLIVSLFIAGFIKKIK